MVRRLWSPIYHHQGKRVWEKGLEVKGKFQGVGSQGGTGVVSAWWGERDGEEDMICGIGGKDLGDYMQATAPERVLLAVWQACGSTKKFRPVEGTRHSLTESGQGGQVPLLGAGVNALRQMRAGLHKPKRLKTMGWPGGSGWGQRSEGGGSEGKGVRGVGRF